MHVCSVCYKTGEFAAAKSRHRNSPSNCCKGCSCGRATQPARFVDPNAPTREQVERDRARRAAQ